MMLDLGPIEERLGSVKKWIVIPGDGLADSNDAVWASDGTKWVCDVDPGMNCATFIAHAPEDIEALIAEVKSYKRLLRELMKICQSHAYTEFQVRKLMDEHCCLELVKSDGCTQPNNT